jgi:hypothetical protein
LCDTTCLCVLCSAPQAPGEGTGAAKKAKAGGAGAVDWAALAAAGAVGKQTVETLKGFCRDKGLALGGKKGDLVARVLEALE